MLQLCKTTGSVVLNLATHRSRAEDHRIPYNIHLNFAFVECEVEVFHQDKTTLKAIYLNWYFKHNSALLLPLCIQSKTLKSPTFVLDF